MTDIRRAANISECGKYRYSLDRQWFEDRFYSPARLIGGHPMPLIFVMLNPSTADAYEDDPTIRRCVGFTKREGFEWLRVINLFAGRATKPADLFKMEDPIGVANPEEWGVARDFYERGAKIICAWGAEPKAVSQGESFVHLMQAYQVELWCLGTTKTGAPKHPLYLPSDAPLSPFPAQAIEASGQDAGLVRQDESAVAESDAP